MTKPDDRQNVTYEEALSLVAAGTTTLILVEGEVSVDTYDAVLEVCTPKPVRVGVYNASEKTVQTVARPLTRLRVGPELAQATPLITVVMKGRQLDFGKQIKVSTGNQMILNETYNSLMPFDGHSLDASLAQATSERRDIIDWLVGGGDMPSSAMKYARLRLFPRFLTVLYFASGFFVGLALLRSGFGFSEVVAIATLVTALALYLNLKALRKAFGYDHA